MSDQPAKKIIIVYGNQQFEPQGEITLEAAKSVMARHFAELADPDVKTETKGDTVTYTFKKKMGTKGADAHTPGPWRAAEWTTGDGTVLCGFEIRPTTMLLAVGDADPETARANANLIAAAPDLLAALEGLVAKVRVDTFEHEYEQAELLAYDDDTSDFNETLYNIEHTDLDLSNNQDEVCNAWVVLYRNALKAIAKASGSQPTGTGK